MDDIKRLSRDLVYKGSIIDFYKDTMQIPNGNIVKWDFIKHKGAAAIIPVTSDGEIIVVRQYRNALERYTLEIPAGGLEADEDAMTCAARELGEEAGYKAGHIEHLLDIYTTVAFCNEKISIYVGTELTECPRHLDEDEYVEVLRYPVDDLIEMVYNNQIQDSKTVSALMTYYAKHYKK